MNLHHANETLVDRLVADGSELSLEAAKKIESLRDRGKFWERATHEANLKLYDEFRKRMDLRRKLDRVEKAIK